jgi:polyhydroxyalkanoate synthase subunit PhaC
MLKPDEWMKTATLQPGSWWPTWQHWLVQHSAQERVAPPGLGNAVAGYPAIADAPGSYIFH